MSSFLDNAKILFDEASKMRLSPAWLTDYGIFYVEKNDQTTYFFSSTTNLNSQMASYLTRNKHATRLILEKNNLPNIPYLFPANRKEIKEFLNAHGKIVIKPTMGFDSQNVKLITTDKEIEDVEFKEHIEEKHEENKSHDLSQNSDTFTGQIEDQVNQVLSIIR